jgi:hypothetical protein
MECRVRIQVDEVHGRVSLSSFVSREVLKPLPAAGSSVIIRSNVVCFKNPSLINRTADPLETFVHPSESFIQKKSCQISGGIKDGNREIFEAS